MNELVSTFEDAMIEELVARYQLSKQEVYNVMCQLDTVPSIAQHTQHQLDTVPSIAQHTQHQLDTVPSIAQHTQQLDTVQYCIATLKNGTKCKNKRKDGDYCGIHKNYNKN